MSMLGRLRADLACGIGLLSRLPTGWLGGAGLSWSMPRSIWCWPMVGGALGGMAALVYAALLRCGVASLPAAGWSIGMQLLLCGGLHEDGLADMADGCGGGRERARKLEIMRDSRVGSYGVMALGVALLVRVGAVAAMPGTTALLALPVAGALARAAMVVVLWRLPPARRDGLASTMTHLPAYALAAGLCGAGALAALMLPGARAGVAVGVAMVAAAVMCRLARWQLGGQTGDVLGATAVVTECAVLAALS
ncbi:adenosylcobinamide-GDP ribazoletransferase [Komagataeibacter sp. FNDCF1]|uniref:adenosylcobinamide-GDP ribazoletransferase n=1 Tax=Komagataeibacter sp. FNDCF1 TaxID=2878681 RepID=UPI001E4466BE|nr:adenosylcobinamide-GDP ribazoletransferase [Komagataeibacter sp. FNDCF1]MCE2564480.1 adenosylcobinamide-GDP ribazoletransferase [Komagataeibacter sp. FNDCF1]